MRPEIEAIIPDRCKSLPVDVDRGYPVPWFVAWENGKPEFRAMDGRKLRRAVLEHLCWVCGQGLGGFRSFVLGPMCTVNRLSAEPPGHRDCAVFSARACPFLSKPQMTRRENDLPAEVSDPAGGFLKHNPGACAVWTAVRHGYAIERHGDGILFRLTSEPTSVDWFTEGRPATREEIETAIARGLPRLEALCRPGTDDGAKLARQVERARKYLPGLGGEMYDVAAHGAAMRPAVQ